MQERISTSCDYLSRSNKLKEMQVTYSLFDAYKLRQHEYFTVLLNDRNDKYCEAKTGQGKRRKEFIHIAANIHLYMLCDSVSYL